MLGSGFGQSPAIAAPPPGRQHAMEWQLLDALSLGLVIFDGSLRAVYRNPAADVLLPSHLAVDEALHAAVLDSQGRNWGAALRCVIEQRRELRFEQIVFSAGTTRERLADLLCQPLTDAFGEVAGGMLILEDITTQAGLEKRLATSERMAAVGQLAARVAHELNNPLDGILRYLNLAIRSVEVGQTDRLKDYLVQARGGILRMAEIVRELSEFSRGAHAPPEHTEINVALEEAVKVMADKADAAGVAIICRLDQRMPAMRGTSLYQVFCNLIKNAVDAMPEGGTLTIVTQVLGREAVIRIEDTGVGLPTETERLFEPFFTTKPPGKGTGLGLAICKEIVEKHQGRITPERRAGGGTVFTIQIPLESCVQARRPDPAACRADRRQDSEAHS